MAELFHYTFATDLSEFNSTTAINGTIAQSAGAGLNGTTGGVLCTRTASSPSLYGLAVATLSGLAAFRFAMYWDISNHTIVTSGHVGTLINFRQSAATSGNAPAVIQMSNVGGALKMNFYARRDSAAAYTSQIPFLASDWVEIETIRETVDGAADGVVRFYFGGGSYSSTGELVAEFLNVDNYIGFNAMTRVQVGMIGGSSSVTGAMKLDEIIARNDNVPILFGVGESTSSRRMRNVLNRRRRKSYCW